MKQCKLILPKEAEQYSCGVYCITNITKNKCYIGQSTQLKTRILTHFTGMKNGTHPIKELSEDYKQGNIFKCEILFKATKCYTYILEGIETFYIQMYQSNVCGYNGDYGSKKKPTEAQKQAINPFIIKNIKTEYLQKDITKNEKQKLLLEEILFLLDRMNWNEEELYLFLKQTNFYNSLNNYSDQRRRGLK